ncbi:hypothetical protein [Frigoribacterium sp. CFBP 13712]|uniref:hypothetical protein n=1 Tax=Frigoribacterium sp. CFBP 13712 TaxID=2775309 RepID=UPI0017832254|nr:hypothetical protein [Frigoribacterium sp. CFBP 13712]MBD8704917.1 hypothetical protein [Frigoribacterium sp. CFBP 13712]
MPGYLCAWQALVMDKDLGTDPIKGHIHAAIGRTIFGAIMIVAFAPVASFTDFAWLSGGDFFLIWGGRAV